MRTGNFTGAKIIPHMPGTTTPFPGNLVPISPQAAYFLQFMPTQAQGVFSEAQSLIVNKGDLKIDAALTSKDHLMGRYSIEDNNEEDPNQYPSLGRQPLVSRAQNYALTESHSFGSNGSMRRSLVSIRTSSSWRCASGTNYDANAGITGYEQTQLVPSFPLITLSGYSGFNGSGSNSLLSRNRIRTWQYGDIASYTNGRHTVQAGYTLYHQRHTFFNGQSQEGQFAFTTMYSGDAFADFLLGYPASVFRAFPISLYGNTANEHAAFIQDDWRPTDRLTLNVGLRYEYNPFFDGLERTNLSVDYNTGKIIIPSSGHNPLDLNAQPEIPQVLPLFRDRLEYTEDFGLPQSIVKPARDKSHPALVSRTASAATKRP